MATRKVNRNVKVGNPRNYSDLYRQSRDATGSTSPSSDTQGEGAPAQTTKRNAINWRDEYGYVMDDMRRLGIVTAVLVVAIIAAGYVL